MHRALNHKGEIIDFFVTSGNVADNTSNVMRRSTKLSGKVYADKGYILKKECSIYYKAKEEDEKEAYAFSRYASTE